MQKIQMKDAKRLSDSWGSKSCDHKAPLMKEYDNGSDTGDLVCGICGYTASKDSWDITKNR